MVDGGSNLTAYTLNFKTEAYQTSAAIGVGEMPLSQLLGIGFEYQLFEQIINKPVTYTIKKWLSISDLNKLEFFKLYSIRQLGGSFFINKTKNFNPNSKQPTELELIKISDKVVSPQGEIELPANAWLLDEDTGWSADDENIMIYERDGVFYDGTHDHDGTVNY